MSIELAQLILFDFGFLALFALVFWSAVNLGRSRFARLLGHIIILIFAAACGALVGLAAHTLIVVG